MSQPTPAERPPQSHPPSDAPDAPSPGQAADSPSLAELIDRHSPPPEEQGALEHPVAQDPSTPGPTPGSQPPQASAESAAIGQAIQTIPLPDLAPTIDRLDSDRQQRMLRMLAPELASRMLAGLPEALASTLLRNAPPALAALWLVRLPSDRRASLLALCPDQRQAIIDALPPDAATDQRSRGRYGPDTAGALMITEFLAYEQHRTVGHVLDDMRAGADRYAEYDVQYAYVVDRSDRPPPSDGAAGPAPDAGTDRLIGVLRLRDLVLSPASTPLRAIMIPAPTSVRETVTLSELHSLFDQRSFFGVPVVDGRGGLVGVVRRSSVEHALAEKLERDYRRSRGVLVEELRSMPLPQRVRGRFIWLSINIVFNLAAGVVIAMNQDTLAAVIALAVFMPIISDMSGCAGNQAVAVTMRELSMGLVRVRDLPRVLSKELSSGVINGLLVGTILAGLAYAWKADPWLGGVVGVALAINTVLAVLVGGALPLVAKAFKQDPALASGPVLTTVTDVCGFMLVLGLAGVVLSKLTQGG